MTSEKLNERLTAIGAAPHLQDLGRDGLVARWRMIVEEVERGYTGSLDEYCNDLGMRNVLEKIGLGQDPEVLTLDQRFRDQLQDTGRRIWSSPHPDDFWVWGYPRNVSEDFRSEALSTVYHP